MTQPLYIKVAFGPVAVIAETCENPARNARKGKLKAGQVWGRIVQSGSANLKFHPVTPLPEK